MKNALNTVCDTCATILSGKKGTAEVTLPFLELRGSLCLNVPNEEDSRYNYDFYYAAQKGDITPLHFCLGTCLEDFMQARKTIVEDGKLRKINQGGYGDSNDWFSEQSN